MNLYAVSDLHVGHPRNRALVEGVGDHGDDWLILAGDVCESLAQFRWALATLTQRFGRVIWTPGNHELWAPKGSELRGQRRYEAFVAACADAGVATPEDPPLTWIGEDGAPLAIAPLFTLYDYSRRPPQLSKDAAVEAAMSSGTACADEYLLDPAPFPSREAWCEERLLVSERYLDRLPADHGSILVSHFPLTAATTRIPLMPLFAMWCGSSRTEDWPTRYRAEVVVSGHLHRPATIVRDGVRYEEVSLGYPREWARTGLTSLPLRLIATGSPAYARGAS